MPLQKKKRQSAPTLVEVAKLAGVGLGTASRALSGDGYVKRDTFERIHKAIEQLGYQPNELARGLKRQRSNVVGIVIPDIGGPFMVACVRAIQRVLRAGGYISIIAFTDNDPAVEQKEIDYLLRHRVDGLIIVPADSGAAHLQNPQLARIPVVAFDQPIQPGDFDAILVKNSEAAQEAVMHLVGHGHTRIACLGVFRHLYSIQRRIEGYRAAMKHAGLTPMLSVVKPEHGEIAAQLDAWLALKEPPTAIFSVNELVSVGIVEAMIERGIKMPDKIAFIGFDDIQLGPFLDPPLTAVVQPAAEIGEHAARTLIERLGEGANAARKSVQLKAKLVVRGSCGCKVTKPRLIR
jgi:LacI family transcriptional regulator